MKKRKFKVKPITLLALMFFNYHLAAQVIPIDTAHWDIQARGYVLEKHEGIPSIYLQGGMMVLKDVEFLNGTIEYDIFLKEERGFPGVFFRTQNAEENAEHFYIRPHQSGNPDANQAAPTVKGITPWQLYFGPRYSFPYQYKFNAWTHVKILVNNDKAQVFLDNSETPQLSWNLFHEAKKGGISLQGGGATGVYLANIKVSHETPKLINFEAIDRPPINGLISSWTISDIFEEQQLDRPANLKELIKKRSWQGKVFVEEGVAANISRVQSLNNGKNGNTVFAKVEITSEQDQMKFFDFGYSDRVVVILNGQPIYRGTNRFRSRDYRYLGTIGLFDGVYLNLKKGKNTLLLAVSEDFGGWLVTGKFKDNERISIE